MAEREVPIQFMTHPKINTLLYKVVVFNGTVFLTTKDLYERWRGKIAIGTINNWRSVGEGPRPTKIGGIPLYHIDEVVKYETERTGLLMGKIDKRDLERRQRNYKRKDKSRTDAESEASDA